MTEWDAMADFLEESGRPEWARMARRRPTIVLAEASGAAFDGNSGMAELLWIAGPETMPTRIIGPAVTGPVLETRRIAVTLELPGASVETWVADTRGMVPDDARHLLLYPPDRIEAHRMAMERHWPRADAPLGASG